MGADSGERGGFLSRIFGGKESDAEILAELSRIDAPAHDIVAAAMAVHAELGYGFAEQVYRNALAIEFADRGVPHRQDQHVTVHYRGRALDAGHTVDFLCHEDTLVQVCSVPELSKAGDRQFINHLRAFDGRRGLLLNFGPERLSFRRMVRAAD